MGLFDEIKNKVKAAQDKLLELAGDNHSNTFSETLDKLIAVPIERNGEKHNRNYAMDIADFSYKNLTKSTSLHKISSFIAFDTETTGIQLTGNDIIELSAIKFIDFEPVEIFSTLIKPRNPIPAEATQINHITNDMVENAPRFYEIIPSFDAFIGNLPMVAHNAPFDVKHLYANGLDSIAKKKVYDTCEISRKMHKELPNHKLATVCNAYHIRFDNAHRAANDTLACGLLFVKLIQEKYGCYTLKDLQSKLYEQ